MDETRPRNQGAALTAFELGAHGIPHTVIVDNAGGHLMQHGQVDVCIVGSDRTTAAGDVANKIGTYLKALAAHDNGVPFYAALPSSTIDWTIDDGVRDIPIEERGAREVTHVRGRAEDGRLLEVEVVAPGSPVANPGLRRHAGAPRHGHHHGARRGPCEPRRAAVAVPGAGGTLNDGHAIANCARAIIAVAQSLDAAGLVPNKSGNVSCRSAGRVRDHAGGHAVP